MSDAALPGFAYLFEKFPSFSQTFCIREVAAHRRAGHSFPVFSIRHPIDEPAQDLFADAGEVTYLPATFDDLLARDAAFRRSARKALDDLRAVWGDESEKRRVYEALWLGPRLQQAGITHVHVHFAGIAARTAFWLKRLFGLGYSITAHANDIFRDEPPERLRQLFDAADVVVTVSDFSVGFLRRNYPDQAAKFVRVYNGIAVSDYPPSSFPPGPPLILSIGRYIEKKGFADLIAACALLRDIDFDCQIVGHGPLEDPLKAQVQSLGLAGKVSVAGPRSGGEIKQLLARTRLFALACVNADDGAADNLPTVIMEAMAAGVPVVSTAVAAVPEMVRDGVNGFVVPEKDPAAFAEKMRPFLTDSSLARRMGAEGLVLCRDIFEVERTSASLREILATHARPPARRSWFDRFR